MQSTSVAKCLLGCVGAGVLAALIGCAVGTDPGVGVSELDTLPVEAGHGDENSVVLPPSTHQDETDAGDNGDDGGADAGTDPDAGSADSGTLPDAGGGGSVSCASPNVCTGATDLGSVSGDTGADTKTASGTGSQWFTVRVSEDDSSVFGTKLRAKAELISPAGANFDLFLYLPGGGSGVECSAVNASSTNASGLDSASSQWGEGSVSNGSNDDRTLTVEVRWVSGTCTAATPWSLTVRGNTN